MHAAEEVNDLLDVVVVGGGAAGLAASSRLQQASVRHLLLEARGRVGGRAHTIMLRNRIPVDLGCGWLHSARQNAWTRIAESIAVPIDRSPAPWSKPALTTNFPAALQSEYRRAFASFEERLARLADEKTDYPASAAMIDRDARWKPLLNAFSGYYNGAPFDRISAKDYGAYEPTEDNWRLPQGYGSLLARFSETLPIELETPVLKIEHDAATVRLITEKGPVAARAVIVAAPTAMLASGVLSFDPPLPHKLEAAAALPLGHVNKVFLSLSGADEFDPDSLVYGRTDSEDTGSYTLRPMGRPLVEGFFGGELAARLEAEPEGLALFAVEELCKVFGSRFKDRLSVQAVSAWGADRWSQGAYSHARPGSASMRGVLAEPVEDRLFFAGEACSPHAFSTAHGAYETGIEAAEAAILAINLKRTA